SFHCDNGSGYDMTFLLIRRMWLDTFYRIRMVGLVVFPFYKKPTVERQRKLPAAANTTTPTYRPIRDAPTRSIYSVIIDSLLSLLTLAAEWPDLVEHVRDARQTHRCNDPPRHWRLEEEIIQSGHQREQHACPEQTPECDFHEWYPLSLELARIAPA
ncbi:MAG TPA: hypothetical protein VEL31_16060, partial [Ktedonobacteraceae bacterium]|nr:hypothetical protein [Ktedonobacteraceae bacterium]